MDKSKLRTIFEYEFRRGTNAAQTARNINNVFGEDATIDLHLRQIGKVKKLEKWVPHELSALQKRHRVDVCLSLLNRSRNEPFLHRIVTCDEKWILYNNRKWKKVILSPGEVPRTIPKPTQDRGYCLVDNGRDSAL
ncbi:hypothetical protein RvY_16799 [Ramazzottius varieornatus]|uniref:Mos1 transposase HTH domain-containing protein n=1 Tax=Ramazzottius varieornatus TaxID=947166 RepID=A0A1D1W422_RAMVA|nr:hypothetical protein RvY_16799 [Ramazzottius varieornatus]